MFRTGSVLVEIPGEKNAIKISYSEKGRGKPVIFLHGLGGSKREFRELIFPHVPPGYRAIAMDFPGFGTSARLARRYSSDTLVEAVSQFLNALGIKKARFVGTSLGGLVLLKFMSRYSYRVIAAAVQGAPFSSKEFPDWVRALAATISFHDFFSGFLWRPFVNKQFFMRLILVNLSPDTRLGRERALELIDKNALELDTRAVINLFVDITTNTELTEAVKEILVPTLFIDGDTVKFEAIDTTAKIASLMTAAPVEMRLIRDATHLAPFSHPQEFVDGIIEFFERN